MPAQRYSLSGRNIFIIIVWAAMLGSILWMILPGYDRPQPETAMTSGTGQPSPSPPRKSIPNPVGKPLRLQIPAIQVDAAIQGVGLTAEGAMGIPENLHDVAWYQGGTRPGEAGNAVMAGHRSSRSWVPAVFDHLDQLQPGDPITVIDDQGHTIRFVVRESRIYGADADPSEIFATSGQVHLNLITCAGSFNYIKQAYPQRLVVFTDAQP